MKLEHEFVVPAPVEEAWAAFNDLERVVPCFPGATLTSYEGDDFAGSCKVKLGPVSLQYTGTGTFAERDPADHHAVVEAKGKDRRGNSTASVRVTARMAASGDDATAVTVETDLTITGRPAQFGRGLIQEVSDNLLSQFITSLTTNLETRVATAEPVSAKPSPDQPAGPSTAAGPSAPAPPAEPVPPRPPSEPSVGESTLDLGKTLLPALVRRARPYLIGAAAALLLRGLVRLLRR